LNAKSLPWSLLNSNIIEEIDHNIEKIQSKEKITKKDIRKLEKLLSNKFTLLQNSIFSMTEQKINTEIYYLDTSHCTYWPNEQLEIINNDKNSNKNICSIYEVFSNLNKSY
jgi:hypothetical protein